MRPGRMKYKARARHRRVAVTAAGVGALTVLGGTAYATEGGGGWQKQQEDPAATLTNGGDANAFIEQHSYVDTEQLALANTGANKALAVSANVNLGRQNCTSSLSGGDISNVDENNTAGNEGGNCTNGAKQGNHSSTDAKVETGDPDEVKPEIRCLHHRESLCQSLHHTVLDPVMDHFHKMTRARLAHVSVSIGN